MNEKIPPVAGSAEAAAQKSKGYPHYESMKWEQEARDKRLRDDLKFKLLQLSMRVTDEEFEQLVGIVGSYMKNNPGAPCNVPGLMQHVRQQNRMKE